MELKAEYETVSRALALALMRQALELLEAADEGVSASHLRLAIDRLLRTAPADSRDGET